MKVVRYVPIVLAAATLAACSGPSRKELAMTNASQADSIALLRADLYEQMTQGTGFLDEINKELAKARSLTPPRPEPLSEIADQHADRKATLQRITLLVTRLETVNARVATLRKQLSEKDSVLSAKVAEYETRVAEANENAQRQQIELQNVIAEQGTKIATLTRQVDTLAGALGQLTAEHNAVYVVVGTRDELRKKGVLVPEGRKRFVVAGARPLVPAKELDPVAFTRLDRRSDTTIVLPDGVYEIVSRQSGSYVTPQQSKHGRVAGAFTIEDPERFWSTSRFLILVRS